MPKLEEYRKQLAGSLIRGDEVAKVISIVNMKGGVGKTTLSIALADYIGCILRKKVCLVDLDAQSNASFAMIGEDNFERIVRKKQTVDHYFLKSGEMFQGQFADYIIPGASALTDGGKNISLVAAQPRLRLVERQALIKVARATLHDHELETRAAAAMMRDFNKLTSNGVYVIIDSAPGISVFATAALRVSDLVIAPVNMDYLSGIGLELLGREIIPSLNLNSNPPLVACRTKARTNVRVSKHFRFENPEFQEQAGFTLMNTVIPLNADLGRIVDAGDIVQPYVQKYQTGTEHAKAFGCEIMSKLEMPR